MDASKQYSPIEIESKWMKNWLEQGIFDTTVRENTESFSIALPPPNVTGELHMGHALGGTIQDILIRYNRMLGKDVLWQIGTDHAGIGTQLVVEKNLKQTEHKRKEDLGREEFLKRVKAWKEEYGNKIIEQMKVLGFSPDYKRIRYTMDDHYASAVQNAFIKYFNDGLIYRGNRVVNWCPKCLTSLSDLEIAKETTKKKLYEIKYQIKDSNESITVATTRPETMFGDVAVAINPNDERFSGLIKQIKNAPDSVKVLIPLSNKEIPVILDEHVKTDFGTGALKVTPAHDANDFEIGKKHGLDKPIIMDKQAKMKACPEIPESLGLTGLDRYAAREKVLALLGHSDNKNVMASPAQQGVAIQSMQGDCFAPLAMTRSARNDVLVQTTEYDQEKDLHDRCNTEIEPYLSEQWYLAMQGLAQKSLDLVASGKSQFTPERYNVIFKNWLENIQDWCVSRQIWWGHRIPVFYYETNAGTPNPFNDKENPADDESGLVTRYYAAEKARELDHRQDDDVLDTWFSSALWPFETLKSAKGELETTDFDQKVFEKFYPTDVLATAREIINLWVTRMIFSSIYFENGKQPFSDILIHPVVQTPDGKRMSKSKGNAIDPLEMVSKYGADASRLWYASVGIHGQQDVKFPGRKDQNEAWFSDTFEQYRKFCNKLFNATKFVMTKLDDGGTFKPAVMSKLDTSNLLETDKWVLTKFSKVLAEIDEAFKGYDLTKIQKLIYEFTWFDFCDWYIEFTKIDSADKSSQKQILFYILEASLRALHPIAPFITEEIWQELKAKYDFSAIDNAETKSICFASYPKAENFNFSEANSTVELIKDLIGNLRNIRQSLDIPWSVNFEVILVIKDQALKSKLENFSEYIKNPVKLSKVSFESNTVDAKPAFKNQISGIEVIVPLSGIVDLNKLSEKIKKQIEKLNADIKVLNSRLSSDGFIKNASPEKIEELKANLDEVSNKKKIFEDELMAIS